jgi:hypothetical protein
MKHLRGSDLSGRDLRGKDLRGEELGVRCLHKWPKGHVSIPSNPHYL